jgi:hypothetical protein
MHILCNLELVAGEALSGGQIFPETDLEVEQATRLISIDCDSLSCPLRTTLIFSSSLLASVESRHRLTFF